MIFGTLAFLSLAQNVAAYGFHLINPAHKIWFLDVDEERSLYTWASSMLMGAIGLVNLFVAAEKADESRTAVLQWLILSLAFFAISCDEMLALHEKIGNLFPAEMLTGVLRFAWVLPGGILCLIGLVLYIPFIRGFPGRARVYLIASAVVFLSGAIGLEMVGGMIEEANGVHNLTYRLASTVEETMEGFGLILYLHAVLLYRRQYTDRLSIRY
ncbi:hypothetical protein [Azospirillum thermophilum]|uniref:hypothetical protein n=1 Tax=Azospirillum thermophilum TaxID=2202148 RepID=UPI0011B37556|nr:hypothetical protein [Azospirillum thermophilum]